MALPAELLAESGGTRLNDPDAWTPKESWVERLCQILCGLALAAAVVMVAAEVVSRALFHFSFQVTDEIGGYLLVLITFLSLPVSLVNHGFHHVEFVQARLSPFGRAVSRIFFDALCLFCAAILLWQLARLELGTWRSGDVAATILGTPLWIPQLSMPIGAAVLLLALVRTLIGDFRRAVALRHGAIEARGR